jgi:activator of HSP90 ATPase
MNARSVTATRRQAVTGIAVTLGSFIASARLSAQQTATAASDNRPNATSLHQEIDLPAAPQRVFDILLDGKQFALVTGMSAVIDPNVGGAFKTFGGLIEGRNVEIIPAQRIVQAWRETSWEAGFYSLVHFELTAQGATTRLALDHTGFHEGDFVHLSPSWPLRYWEPLKKYLTKHE